MSIVTGLYVWMGGPTLGAMADSTIMHTTGPPEKKKIKGEALLVDGAFGGLNQVITPWRKPRKKDMPKRWQEYNARHAYIRSRGVILALQRKFAVELSD